MKRKITIYWDYFKQKKIPLLLWGITLGMFTVVFWLYELPLDPVSYGLVLCVFFGLLIFFFGAKKHENRIAILASVQNQWIEGLVKFPKPEGKVETMYQNLILELLEENKKLHTEFDEKEEEMMGYYTLWAHQIKTPISAMALLLQQGEEQSPCLRMELFKIQQYVDMVLGYAKLQSTGSDLVLQYYHLDEIVKQSVRNYAQMFIQKQIKLELEDCHAQILTDEKWLVFVMEQLLSNGLKYTPQGSIKIYLETEGHTSLVIEDTGIGIAPEDLPRVFDKGFTGYNGRLDKKATGIGLYLCQDILNKLSHEIFITSQIGGGTKVKITFVSGKNVME